MIYVRSLLFILLATLSSPTQTTLPHWPDFDSAMACTPKDHQRYITAYLHTPESTAFFDFARERYTKHILQGESYSKQPRIPKIIHQIWIGPHSLPEPLKLMQKTWLNKHPDWQHMFWTNEQVASLELINREYFEQETNWGAKADILRLELLHQFGGLYVDVDFECIQPFDLLHHHCDFYAGFIDPSHLRKRARLNNALIAAAPGHPAIKKLIDEVKNYRDRKNLLGRTGPDFFTNTLHKIFPSMPGVNLLFPANFFYPWSRSKKVNVQPETFAAHHYAGTWYKLRGPQENFPLSSLHTIEHELPLVVLICSYNNAPWVLKNLNSVFNQNYHNFRVIYFDDGSTDGTAQLVQEYIDQHNLHDQCTLITTPSRYRKMKHLYSGIHLCKDNEIIIQLDGDDWFISPDFFAQTNQRYQTGNTWVTYGSYQNYPSGKRGSTQPVPEEIINSHGYRTYKFVYMHPRTFYAWIAKLIKLEDLITCIPEYVGNFYPASNDLATMMPIVEMSHKKTHFVHEISYAYNRTNPLLGGKVDRKLQKTCAQEIHSKPSYPIVASPIIDRLKLFATSKADVLILSQNNPNALKECIESLSKHLTGLGTITVLFEANTQKNRKAYELMQQMYDKVTCTESKNNTNSSILELLNSLTSNHTIIMQDTKKISGKLDINYCIKELERTFAHGFYFEYAPEATPFHAAHTQAVPLQHIYNTLYAWKFSCGAPTVYHAISMVLLRKQELIDRVKALSTCTTVQDFIIGMEQQNFIAGHKVGLFFSKINPNDDRLCFPVEQP